MFAERGGLFGKALFLWTIVFSINLLFYFVLSKIIIPSNFARDYLSADNVSYFFAVVKFYLFSSILGYIAMAILKIFQDYMSDNFLYSSILLACLDYVHICHFFGGLFVILAPMFIIISVTNVSIFLSPKMGRFTLFCSFVLFVGAIVLNITGYFPFNSVVLNTVRFNDVITNSTLMITFSVIFSLVLLVFGNIIIRILDINSQKTEQTVSLNAELEASNQKFKEMDALKTEFLAMVSHDLRTPITSIKGYIELLRNKMDKLDKEEQKSFLEIVEKETDRLARLTSDLLDLQRMESGMVTFEFRDFDIIKLLDESINTFQGAAYSKNISIHKEMTHHEILIRADRDRLSQVTANLLSNAIKFTPKDGEIIIRAEMINENGNSSVKVAVSDTGPGIPEDFQAVLFDKIKRVYQLDHVREKGSGLGLAIVKEIIKHHKGEVGIESELGKGSTFYFTLPMKA